MSRKILFAGVSASLALILASPLATIESLAQGVIRAPSAPTVKPRHININLDKALKVKLPVMNKELSPKPFKTPDGKEGWALRISGGHPIATPAYWGGMLFVGGGYGSKEFYAFDAKTGALVWKFQCSDDGPTAAVVENGLVAFNTESCTVYVVDAKTGKLAWQEWLGDPLMSQPAISRGKLYIVYPAGQRGNANGSPQQIPVNAMQAAQQALGNAVVKSAVRHTHRLLCADLKTGKHLWQAPLSSDAISAPVIEKDKVYLTLFDGTSVCVGADSGKVLWKKAEAGTSAPAIADGQVIMAHKEITRNKAFEGMRRVNAQAGMILDQSPIAQGPAPYLQGSTNGTIGLQASSLAALDASVGFGGGAPEAAQLKAAKDFMGISSVAGAWGYQGARPVYAKGAAVNAQSNFLNSVDAKDGSVRWRAEAHGKAVRGDSQLFSPPSMGRQNMYLASAAGHMVAVDQSEGKVGFMYDLQNPISFQPALAGGNIYFGTSNGMLMCVKTGNSDADGWTQWGGNAQHNKSD